MPNPALLFAVALVIIIVAAMLCYRSPSQVKVRAIAAAIVRDRGGWGTFDLPRRKLYAYAEYCAFGRRCTSDLLVHIRECTNCAAFGEQVAQAWGQVRRT